MVRKPRLSCFSQYANEQSSGSILVQSLREYDRSDHRCVLVRVFGRLARWVLRTKGHLAPGSGKARELRPANSFREHQRSFVHVPLYGSILRALRTSGTRKAVLNMSLVVPWRREQ